jgi:predicted DNA-binding transcriptional regulator AlpA
MFAPKFQTSTDRPLHERPAQISTSASRTATGESDSAGLTRLLDERQAAALLGVSVALMRKLRRHGNPPIVTRISRLVRYAEADLLAFIAANRGKAA